MHPESKVGVRGKVSCFAVRLIGIHVAALTIGFQMARLLDRLGLLAPLHTIVMVTSVVRNTAVRSVSHQQRNNLEKTIRSDAVGVCGQ